MNENEKVGKRLHVMSKTGQVDLGLGTYLFMDTLLLDTGKKIFSKNCTWEAVPSKPVPPFEITITEKTRVFEGETNLHLVPQIILLPGTEITIEKIEVRGWNHGSYVAGMFTLDSEPYALVMSEVALPEEKPPHFRVIK